MDEKSPYSKILKKSKHPILIIGEDALRRDDGELVLTYAKKIAEKFNMISDSWNGFNFLHKDAALVGALDAGFVSKDKKINRDAIIKKLIKHDVKAVYLLGDDSEDLKKIEESDAFVIYQGSHGERGAHIADVILPAAAYTEKNATYVNTEGRAQQTKRAVFAPKDAKEDWQLISELAEALKINLGFKDLASLRKLLEKENPIFGNLNQVTVNKWVESTKINSSENFSDDKLLVKISIKLMLLPEFLELWIAVLKS